MEKFKCECGFIISVEFSEGENERDVPCGACYWEEWEDKILASHFDEEKQKDVVDDRELIKHQHGNMIHCIKGSGI